MRVSVVIPTYNRVASLRDTLEGLRRQTVANFEVVVVNGPSTDGTATFLDSLADSVRSVRNEQRNLSRSRNVGIAAAAGELVAFIDDDAVPEPRWLEDLVAAFDSDRVAGAGGVVLDHTGVRVQWRHLVSSRVGDQDFDQEPPLDRFARPGADPFLYLAGGNCAMRRSALADVGGFDEEIEYNFDEAEVCLRLLDRGWQLRSLDGAVVHHRSLPSHQRSARAFTDPYFEVKNRVYFALRHGRRGANTSLALASTARELGRLRAGAREAERAGHLTSDELARYLGRADQGYHVGLQRGLKGERRGCDVLRPETAAFLAYPIYAPPARRRVAVVGPAPDAVGVLAGDGHEVHELVLHGPGDSYRVDYRAGAWIHVVPVCARWLPELDGSALRPELEETVALRAALAPLRERESVEVEVPGGSQELRDLLRLSDRDAERALHALLSARAALPPERAADVARRLLEPERFPIDYEHELRHCLGLPGDEDFVSCAYAALLGRAPDPLGARSTLVELGAGTERTAVVQRMATSVEARGRRVDPAFVARLPAVSLAAASAALRAAWLEEDREFARRVHRILRGTDAGAAADVGRLAEGLSRQALVRELAALQEVQARVAGAVGLPPADVLSRQELAAQLSALAGVPLDEFVAAVYRLLLGRAVDPEGAVAYGAALAAGRSRAWVVETVAGSKEARRRGWPPAVVLDVVRRGRAYRRDALRRRLGSRLRRFSSVARRAS